ncbi:NAD(P)/FAD-dependent oxidoreductase [Allokutzneria sp. NRRL B-24872]|uniref:FAD-dependent oxidoreductase n=1 Tax=Allokutzneria sp. NRRL B-24872 TaxID=1137961 RepID=UPI000A360FBD|nr:NAD(P)/FAD-dependent oxidoreductase [Allokutzneria sp. NRRL B-24872]
MTEVIVVGGGIGGLALAHGLRGAGVGVRVFERDRQRSDRLQGFRIHLNPHGIAALAECLPAELLARVQASGGRGGDQFTFITERMKRLLHLDKDIIGSGHLGISRITLRQILLSDMDDVVRFDKRFTRYSHAPDGRVTAHFEDGTSATGDVLVGADGAGSKVCAQYLPHARREDTGIVSIAGKYMLTERNRELLPPALLSGPKSVLPPKSCGLFIAPHEFDGGVNDRDDPDALFDNTAPYLFWSFSAKREHYGADVDSLEAAGLHDLVLKLTVGWAPQLRALVALSDVDSTTRLPIRTSVPVPKWETSNVTVLGDAIHSMTPFRGIGANIALRDAQLLCRKLIEPERPLLSRIAEYEEAMIDYGFAAVRASLSTARQSVGDSRLARMAGRAAFRVMDAVPSLKRRAFSTIGT